MREKERETMSQDNHRQGDFFLSFSFLTYSSHLFVSFVLAFIYYRERCKSPAVLCFSPPTRPAIHSGRKSTGSFFFKNSIIFFKTTISAFDIINDRSTNSKLENSVFHSNFVFPFLVRSSERGRQMALATRGKWKREK